MRFLSIFTLCFILLGCGKPDPNTLVIGTIAGPETDLVDEAKKVALKHYGLNVKIIEFSDYNLPNEALMDGTLDANVYQHEPYLNAATKAHGYNFEVIGKTFVYPAGLYSTHLQSLDDLKNGATIALPNDPSNEARALLLLQTAHLITLKHAHNTTLNDILTNPKHIHFKELDAAQLPRVLTDVDAAVINTTFAIPAGLSPKTDAIFIENKDSPYANLIVIRKNSDKKAQLALWVKALNSKAVEKKAYELFGDGAIKAW